MTYRCRILTGRCLPISVIKCDCNSETSSKELPSEESCILVTAEGNCFYIVVVVVDVCLCLCFDVVVVVSLNFL